MLEHINTQGMIINLVPVCRPAAVLTSGKTAICFQAGGQFISCCVLWVLLGSKWPTLYSLVEKLTHCFKVILHHSLVYQTSSPYRHYRWLCAVQTKRLVSLDSLPLKLLWLLSHLTQHNSILSPPATIATVVCIALYFRGVKYQVTSN